MSLKVVCLKVSLTTYSQQLSIPQFLFPFLYFQGPIGFPGEPGEAGDAGTPVSYPEYELDSK